jgi:hypothetical protein
METVLAPFMRKGLLDCPVKPGNDTHQVMRGGKALSRRVRR